MEVQMVIVLPINLTIQHKVVFSSTTTQQSKYYNIETTKKLLKSIIVVPLEWLIKFDFDVTQMIKHRKKA